MDGRDRAPRSLKVAVDMGLPEVMASLLPGRRDREPKYTSLPVSVSDSDDTSDSTAAASQKTYPADIKGAVLRTTMGAAIAVLVGYLVFTAFSKISQTPSSPRACNTPEEGYQCHANITHSWGQYSPFFSVPSEISPSVPASCTLTFAQVLSRHGARAPTASKSVTYASLITRIHSSVASYGPGFEFIQSYRYALGADGLTPFGRSEMVDSGIHFYRRYHSLTSSISPFVRASGQDRVVESALHWTEGFRSQLDPPSSPSDDDRPIDILIIPEGSGVNNSLSHGRCTAFEPPSGAYSGVGSAAADTFLAVFAPPIAARLNAGLPGANLTDAEAVYLMDLCAFETVASPSSLSGKESEGEEGRGLSPFCGLFDAAEWADYSYYQSVSKWYGYGPGNPLGATQGTGWVNELVSRLTGSPVDDGTTTNATLDGDEETFPLGRGMYADFSHDNDMTGVYAALGLYNGTEGLDTEVRRGEAETGGYAASWTVPFGARMYVEKMVCEDGGQEEMVRVLVNDRVVPLRGCGVDELGRCRLGAFVESLGFARGGGNWDMCFK